jgi:uncharacterized oligopeptide transporter (OPT) family protein
MSAGPERGSPIRYVAAMVSLMAAIVTLPAGLVFMISALERGGYGSSTISVALLWLAAGGAFLGVGIALLIWELSVRHNIRH